MKRLVLSLSLGVILLAACDQIAGAPLVRPSAAAVAAPPTVIVGPPDTVAPTATRMLFSDTPNPTLPPLDKERPGEVPSATATPLPSATITAAPPTPVLKQLTQGKCCTQPFWSADSQRVMFIDKPNAQSPTGIYGVAVDSPAAPQLVTTRIANYTSDMQYAISFDGAFTTVERVADKQQWHLNTGGRNVVLSPDRTHALWNVTPETYPFENRVTTIWLATLGPGGQVETKKLTTVLRGSAMTWLDDQRLLMTARLSPASQVVTLFVYALADGSTTNLAASERLRGVSPAPGGDWLAYTIAFDKDAVQNGTWVVRTDGSPSRKLNFFGAFQWRDSQRLVYVPLEANIASHAFYEYNVVTDSTRPLTDPARTPFKIANGDWAISPDGRKIVFVNAQDMNLWLVSLP